MTLTYNGYSFVGYEIKGEQEVQIEIVSTTDVFQFILSKDFCKTQAASTIINSIKSIIDNRIKAITPTAVTKETLSKLEALI